MDQVCDFNEWEPRILAILSFYQWMEKEEMLLALELDIYQPGDWSFTSEQFEQVLESLRLQGKVKIMQSNAGVYWQRQMPPRKAWYKKIWKNVDKLLYWKK